MSGCNGNKSLMNEVRCQRVLEVCILQPYSIHEQTQTTQASIRPMKLAEANKVRSIGSERVKVEFLKNRYIRDTGLTDSN